VVILGKLNSEDIYAVLGVSDIGGTINNEETPKLPILIYVYD